MKSRPMIRPRENRAFSSARLLDRSAIQKAGTYEPRDPVVVRSLLASHGPAYTLSPEPMTDDPILDAQGRPRSVWSALLTLDRVSYRELVGVAYGYRAPDACEVLADSLLFEAVQTHRSAPLASGQGWSVWIDSQGRARVEVYP